MNIWRGDKISLFLGGGVEVPFDGESFYFEDLYYVIQGGCCMRHMDISLFNRSFAGLSDFWGIGVTFYL